MKHIYSYHSTRYPCAPCGDVGVTASSCTRALLCLAVVLSAMSASAAEPGNYLSERFEPLADVPAAKQVWHFRWERYARSTEGRPIETLQIGKGPFRTLVLGSLHGSETMAVEIVEQLARHLGKTSDHWHEVNVLIVRTPNPDGFAKHNSLNARKVDLNRNFPTLTDRQSKREPRAGTSAFSEVETRVLRDILRTYRPHRVVHVKSTRNTNGWALCSRRADAMAAFLCEFRNLHVGRLEDHLVSGSVERYAIGTLGLETVTLAVPNRPDKATVWRDYRSVLLAAAAYVDPEWQTTHYQTYAPARSTPNVSTQQPYGTSGSRSNRQTDRGVLASPLRRSSRKKRSPLGKLWKRLPPSIR
jgi:hypothetical protein